MSSYRSYRPWNSSLSSYSSSSSASNYRSRYGSDATSSATSTAKFSSITPSSYRPSYSSTSGTYRASRAPPVSSTSSTPTYTRTYSSLGKTSTNDEEKEKPKSYTRTYTSSVPKINDDEKEKSKTYTRTYTSSVPKLNDDKKEPSPPKRTSSRLTVKELSAETKSRLSTYSGGAKKEEKGPPITFNTRYKVSSTPSSTRGARSRDPSPSVTPSSQTTKPSALERITAARSRDPSPSISAYSRISSARSRDPSPVSKSYTDSNTDSKSSLTRTYSNTLSASNKDPKPLGRSLSNTVGTIREKSFSTLTPARERSRDPSPSFGGRRPSITTIISSTSRSRDPSPVDSKLLSLSSYRISNGKEKSREPSPSITLSKPKIRESSPSLSLSNYRRSSREPSPAESLSKLSSSGYAYKTISKASSPQQKSNNDLACSYMSTSESIAANAARATRISFINRHSPQKESSIDSSSAHSVNNKKQESESESEESTSSDDTTESSEEEEEEIKPEPKIMIQVTTITRGTSPNPPGITSTSRLSSRRVEVAKTLEKVRERPLIGPVMEDKATQSDRMDDTTRYSRYGITVRSGYTPYSPSPTSYSSRYTGVTSSRYSEDPEKSDSSKSDKFNFSLPKSKEGSPAKSDSRSSSIKSPSPSKICVSKDRNRSSPPSQSKSKSPVLPTKSESPKSASPKVTNKDFRKSALNTGPSDRQQRSKSTSSENSSPTVEKTREVFQQMLDKSEQQSSLTRVSTERSTSVESDSSSSTESVEVESQIQPHEMTKEEKITVKVEEAKNFLLKTLGNPTFSMQDNESVSTNYPNDDENEIDNEIENESEDVTIQQDTNQVINGFSEMTLNSSHPDNKDTKWLWGGVQSLKGISRTESGEKAWWCQSPENKMANSENLEAIAQNNENATSNMWEQETQADISELQKDDEIREIEKNFQNTVESFNSCSLGDRASPEGLESHIIDRKSPYDNLQEYQNVVIDFNARPKMFISRHTNIDEILGGSSVFSPTSMERPYLEMISPSQVRIHDSNSPPKTVFSKMNNVAVTTENNTDYQQVEALPRKLDDAAIQVYKDGDFGAYLDLESSLAEQSEEIEGLNSSRKNSLVVRTQLSVRVHAIIEKLLTSEGRELRRALFSLKQIFQEDKDLVHGFVALGGLNCLVQIGNVADQNYQNYILRALGQVMLYVDGMNGVMKHSPTIQWLYTLIASKYRLVVKTALKLLLVFVEYCEGNCYLLVNAIRTVDNARGSLPWTNIMKLLKDYDNADTELLIYATSLINKTLSGLSDQDSFYDESDFLEQQGMESIIQRYMSRTGTDLDLLDQFQLYEAALRFEDGESDEIIRLPDNTVRKTLRYRSSDSTERRKSRRHSTGTTTAAPPIPPPIPTYSIVPPVVPPLPLAYMIQQQHQTADNDSSSSGGGADLNGFADCKVREGVAGVTPGLRRRRERAERQKSFQREQEANVVNGTTKAIESDEYGKHKHPLANGKECDNHHQSEHQQYIISNNRTSSSIGTNNSNNGDLNNSNGNSLILNNNASVTNSKAYHHHHINNNNVLCNNNQNGVSKSVILNYDKNTLEYKNNKNLILNRQQQNKVEHTTTNTMATNGFANKHNHQIYEKHLNGINQLKNELLHSKKHYITNGVENCADSHHQKSNKFHIAKNHHNGIDETDNNHLLHHTTTNGILSKNHRDISGSNVLENIPTNVNIHKVNGLLRNGHHHPVATVKVTEITNGYAAHHHHENGSENGYNGFVRNCSHNSMPAAQSATTNGRPNDFSTIKINYVSRQHIVRGSSMTVSNGGTNNFHGTSLHELNPSKCATTNIPNIVINGGNDHFGEKMVNGPSPSPSSSSSTLSMDEKEEIQNDTENEDKKLLQQLKREQTVKDLTQKLSNLPLSPQEEKPNRIVGDMSGLISKAKEELNKSKNKVDVKTNVETDLKKPEPKKSEIELHWEELMKNLDRDLILCDLDFRDLTEVDDKNVLMARGNFGSSIPPPPPPAMGTNPVPPPMQRMNGLVNGNSPNETSNGDLNSLTLKKTKKTVKLFWKEVREDLIPPTIESTIWDELPESNVDTTKLEHLFESRAKDLLTKKQQELNKSKEIIVLDHKRSNAINIAMTKLPPPRAIKAAILKMDSTVVTREGIEKLLNMLPTDEERGKIQEAQMLSPELPLGSAEQFLLTLSSISELAARLKLWAFKLDFENIEKEIAEPLMDLKQGIEMLKSNLTFKCILSTLLSIGCFLNGQPVKGFQIEYLAKVPEVKDTVHKHSLLHHLCHMVMETSPNTTDLYSEIGPITRASKADFTELAHNIKYLETECKASWDRLKLISKHDTAPQLKQKLIDFLADCAERIIILDVVHRRVINRYHKFLLWLGVPPHRISESRPNEFCRILSEFALEYRTTRERVHQQIEKKANHRERNKTRGKLIIDVAKFKTGSVSSVVGKDKDETSKDAELRQLLGSTVTDGPETADINGTFTFRRRRPETFRSPSVPARDESFTDGDDEILESLVKTATKTANPRPVQRERKRTRNADRKSLRRTLRNGLTEEEKHHIQQLIQGY